MNMEGRKKENCLFAHDIIIPLEHSEVFISKLWKVMSEVTSSQDTGSICKSQSYLCILAMNNWKLKFLKYPKYETQV